MSFVCKLHSSRDTNVNIRLCAIVDVSLYGAGEEIAKCPSCSLFVRVIYDPADFVEFALAA